MANNEDDTSAETKSENDDVGEGSKEERLESGLVNCGSDRINPVYRQLQSAPKVIQEYKRG